VLLIPLDILRCSTPYHNVVNLGHKQPIVTQNYTFFANLQSFTKQFTLRHPIAAVEYQSVAKIISAKYFAIIEKSHIFAVRMRVVRVHEQLLLLTFNERLYRKIY
jgi:hypothetical protein